MSSQEAALVDRVLHARAEGLLRRAVRDGMHRFQHGRQPLVVVGADRSRAIRWVPRGLEPGHLAALVAELDAIACGLLVCADDTAPGRIEGTALTVSPTGARALALRGRRRLLRRPGVGVRPGVRPSDEAVAAASALCRVLGRAAEDRAGLPEPHELPLDERSA